MDTKQSQKELENQIRLSIEAGGSASVTKLVSDLLFAYEYENAVLRVQLSELREQQDKALTDFSEYVKKTSDRIHSQESSLKRAVDALSAIDSALSKTKHKKKYGHVK